MSQDSNIGDVVRWLEAFVYGFDFRRHGVDKSLGRDLVAEVVGRIQERSAQSHQAPDGSTWPPNSTKPTLFYKRGYMELKEVEYEIFDEPNFRTGQMLSELSLGLNAKTVYLEHEIEIRYGIDSPPTVSRSPNGYLSDEDKKVTDTQKAEWAHMDNPRTGKPARPFYGFGEGDAEALVKIAQQVLNDYILESPYGRAS